VCGGSAGLFTLPFLLSFHTDSLGAGLECAVELDRSGGASRRLQTKEGGRREGEVSVRALFEARLAREQKQLRGLTAEAAPAEEADDDEAGTATTRADGSIREMTTMRPAQASSATAGSPTSPRIACSVGKRVARTRGRVLSVCAHCATLRKVQALVRNRTTIKNSGVCNAGTGAPTRLQASAGEQDED
jgi:hypothetical protein